RPVIPEARPLAELGNAFTAVAEATRPAVVYIQVEAERSSRQGTPSPFDFFQQPDRPQLQQGSGSGFIISQDGLILTNNHVVEGAQRVRVRLFDDREFDAEVVGGDPLTDVAVIKIDGSNLPTVPLGNSDEVAVGQWVLAIGTPLSEAFSFTVTAGIVSAHGRLLAGLVRSPWGIQDFIQTDAAINRGNSGGPLVNVRGEVIGINSAIASETGTYNGYGFAIPINLVQRVSQLLISEGRVRRAAIGVSITAVDQEAADYVGLDEIRGVLISDFPDGDSPARDAGLRQGDVIVEVDGEQIEYTSQLQTIVGFKRPGDNTEITVMRRGGERRTYTVRLIEAVTDAEQTVASTPREEETEYAGSFESRLGISIEEFDRDLANRMGLRRDVDYGLMVLEVNRDGPARGKLNTSSPRNGLLEIITHVEGQRVTTKRELDNVLDEVPAGEVVSLRVVTITGGGQQSRLVFIRTDAG
ncbi:MAG: trypsin-like peptidase domain-containing protein, partial [Gemmatimonadota bacterium]